MKIFHMSHFVILKLTYIEIMRRMKWDGGVVINNGND